MLSQVTQIRAIYQIPPAIDSLQWCKILPDNVNITVNGSSANEINVDRLLPTLIQCFSVVFCGFLAGRCNLISTTNIKGLNDFTTYFTLPPLIFLNLVTINFQHINWLFVLGILVGKIIVFLLVAIVTTAIHKPINLSYAGIYGIFCTQGNDFGLAYPIVASLYGSKRPLYPGYMYLIAPTSLLLLNPMGFILMEIQKNKVSNDSKDQTRVFRTVSWNILRNPIVFVTLLGVLGNFLFKRGLPSILFGILQILSSAFSASVLFLLGFSVARTGESKYSKKEDLLIPSVLLITKMLASPLITRSCVSAMCADAPDVEDLTDFGFLYGMVPTGPIAILFAAEYGLRTEMMASTMVLSTALFGPMVFILARMLTLKAKGIQQFTEELRMTMLILSLLSFLACLWIGLSFVLSKKIKRHIYKVTGCLMISQMVMVIGIFLWSLFQSSGKWMSYMEIVFIETGQLMCRIWVAILAVSLVYLKRDSLPPFNKNMFWSICLGFGFPTAIVAIILIATGIEHWEPDLDKELPFFFYGTMEAVGSIIVSVICLTTTIFCLVLYFRTSSGKLPIKSKIETSNLEQSKEIETESKLIKNAAIAMYKMRRSEPDLVFPKIVHCKPQLGSSHEVKTEKSQWTICKSLKRSETSFNEKHLLSPSNIQSPFVKSSPLHSLSSYIGDSERDGSISTHFRHILLLVLCCISMAVGLTLSTWKLSTKQPNGLYIAMKFLDAILNVGQGVFYFIVFIKDSKYIVIPVSKWIRKVRHGYYSLDDSNEAMDIVILRLCNQFQTYHWDNCRRELPQIITKDNHIFYECFTGHEFVDWILKVGLANQRIEAENYGQRLLIGNVLKTANGAVQFHDNNAYVYYLEGMDKK